MRRFFVPEVVQTSNMDCGPAALACLLSGFGIRASYGRLREACQTEVDGTSIDVLETVANQMSLAAEQIMLPVDHLLLPESAALPAIVVVRQAIGTTHFVVAWRRHGPFVQVMDPGVGRRWMRVSQLLNDVHVHTQRIPAEAFNAWVRTTEFQSALTRRLRELKAAGASRKLIANAASEPGWRGLAALDAAIRLTTALVRSGGVPAGRAASKLVEAIWKRALTDESAVPDSFWFACPDLSNRDKSTPSNLVDAEEHVLIRGAVLVRAIGPKPRDSDAEPLSPELAAAMNERKPKPWRSARIVLGPGSTRAIFGLAVIVLVVAALSLVETVLLRSFIDLGRDLALVEQRLVALSMIIGVGLIELLFEFRLSSGLLRLGRHLEVRFRVAFAEKLPKLNDRYFHSRPVSDMAERSHAIRHLRMLPKLFGMIGQTTAGLVLTAGAIALFDPSSGLLAAMAAATAILLPLAFGPWLTELDMRIRTLAGSLNQFYFDAMQGLTTIKAHSAERVVQREQESLLVDWVKAGRKHLSVVVALEGLQLMTGFTLAAWLLVRHVHALSDTGGALLLAYWALSLPEMGGALAALARQYPWHRNTLLRMLEPLGAPEDVADRFTPARIDGENTSTYANTNASTSTSRNECGAALSFQNVAVVAAGHVILREITFDIAPGSHVAVVGPSGAGKSSLIGVLLGWHRTAAGEVRVDGELLDATRLERLRRQTAWVDPAVQVWNRSLVDNLRFGQQGVDAERLGSACSQAELIDVLEKLPDGLQTVLGEGGGLLSGGQGQRVRLGRAMLQQDARLILLDEPFRGLDHGQRRELGRRLRLQFCKSTMLFISHDVGDTLDFDRVLVIDGGRVVEDGSPTELANANSLYRRMLDAEESVRRDIWQSPCWRHLRLADGQLTEHPE